DLHRLSRLFAADTGPFRELRDRVDRLAADIHLYTEQAATAARQAGRPLAARSLHDDLRMKAAMIGVDVERIERSLIAEQATLHSLQERIGEIASDIHNLSHELHPAKLQTLGLMTALQALCRDVSTQRSLLVVFTHDVVPSAINPHVSLCLYRIAQE